MTDPNRVEVTEADIHLGNLTVPGVDQPVSFWMSTSQHEYWKHTHLTVDVVKGRGSGFSVEAPEGVRFLIRSRLLADVEMAYFQLIRRCRSAVSGLPRPGLPTVRGMSSDWSLPVGRVTDADGHSWLVGTDAEVAWIAAGTHPNLTITAAIPPVFDAYATVVLPDNGEDQERYNRAMLATLAGQSPGSPWWLGYLNTSDFDMVSPGVAMARLPKVALYSEWDYVLVEAGPSQAATWRRTEPKGYWWDDALPELMFPTDRSWLVSTLTDDDWTCVGGPALLIDRLVAHPDLRARRVQLGDEATPPGHRAF